MSIKIMTAVWERGPRGSAETMVLLALADFCNDDGECWPSIETVATKARMTGRGVQKIMTRLCEIGWLTVDRNAAKRGCNLYRITPERGSPPNVVHPERGSPDPRTQFTPTPEPRSPEPSFNHQEPSEEPPCVPHTAKHRRRPEVELPVGWVPSERNISDAHDRNFSAQEIEDEADKFRNHHTARGSRFRDWDAAWRTWIGNARKFSGRGMAGASGSGRHGQGGSIASIAARRWASGQV